MKHESEDTFTDRLVTLILGGFCGLIYGFVIAALIALVTKQFTGSVVVWSAGVFALVGFVYGNIIIEAFLGLLHFFVGLANGAARNDRFEPEQKSGAHLRAFALVGFFTGLILLAARFRWPL